jgi:hypothetical protein
MTQSTCHEEGMQPSTAGWGHLVGPMCPNLQQLVVDKVRAEPDLLVGLSACPLTYLNLGDAKLSAATQQQLALLAPVCLPHVTELHVGWQPWQPALVRALSQQLVSLTLSTCSDNHAICSGPLLACSALTCLVIDVNGESDALKTAPCAHTDLRRC